MTTTSEAMPLQSGAVPAPTRRGGVCLLVHGGAWDIPATEHAAHLDGLRQALDRGRDLLRAGTSALDVVTEVVAVMESHGAFDAGRGAVLTRAGTVELDAGVMCGETLDYGAVMGVRRLENPVRVARHLATFGQGEVRILTAEGAHRLAEAAGLPLTDPAALICTRERERFERLREEAGTYHTSRPFMDAPHGTVGCVARDRAGRLAAATSTGGTPFRPAGRVGDSPLPGSGFYATGQAAASATGWGEAIAAVLLCGRAVDAATPAHDPLAVATARLRHLHERIKNPEGRGAAAGLILLTRDGRGAWACSTPRMARGGWREDADGWVAI